MNDEGTCSDCTGLSVAHYWTTGGGLSNSCTETACIRSDNQCAMGEYRADCTDNDEGECVLCTQCPGSVVLEREVQEYYSHYSLVFTHSNITQETTQTTLELRDQT